MSDPRSIIWKCRRGMLELDVMLTRFVESRLPRMDDEERSKLMQLLDTEDDKLWDWLSGRVTPENSGMKTLVQQIRRQNKN